MNESTFQILFKAYLHPIKNDEIDKPLTDVDTFYFYTALTFISFEWKI